MIEDIYTKTKENMSKSIESLGRKFTTIRTGRVNTSILDNISIDYYGNMTPISQVANINTLDATTIKIDPFDKTLIKDLSKAISEANIGANPNDDDTGIKLFFAPMTIEQRQIGVKQAKKMTDEIKVAIRNNRKDGNDKIKKLFNNKDITEDENKEANTNIQKITDSFIIKADENFKEKEKDLLTV